MHITRFGSSQRDAVAQLLTKAGLPTEGFDPAPDRTIVAREGDRVLGTASLHLYGDAALLRSVVVAEDSRGRGLGGELTEEALHLARRLGADTVYLLTETASRFFTRLGFEIISRDDVPPDVATDVEFTTVCPSSAIVMATQLVRS